LPAQSSKMLIGVGFACVVSVSDVLCNSQKKDMLCYIKQSLIKN
jgi:hypothetical protein